MLTFNRFKNVGGGIHRAPPPPNHVSLANRLDRLRVKNRASGKEEIEKKIVKKLQFSYSNLNLYN